jgi:hypothetical protein
MTEPYDPASNLPHPDPIVMVGSTTRPAPEDLPVVEGDS